jgi:hypothetical protein
MPVHARAARLKRQRQAIGVNPGFAGRARLNDIAGIMRGDRISYSPALDDQIDPSPEGHRTVMGGGKMIEQFHPKTGHGFVVNVDPVTLGKISQGHAHPARSSFERSLIKITQRHRDMGAMLELRRQNRRFLEGAHQFAHFVVAAKIPYFNFQLYPAGASRVQRKSTITAPITDMMKPAG